MGWGWIGDVGILYSVVRDVWFESSEGVSFVVIWGSVLGRGNCKGWD